jgi:hypothetical protein
MTSWCSFCKEGIGSVYGLEGLVSGRERTVGDGHNAHPGGVSGEDATAGVLNRRAECGIHSQPHLEDAAVGRPRRSVGRSTGPLTDAGCVRSIGCSPSFGCERSAGEEDFDALLATSATRFPCQNYKGEPNTSDRF